MTALRLLTEKALEAFWQTIVEQFPEAISGDLSPGATITLSIAAEQAVDEWIENNVNTQDCDITVGYRFRLFRIDGQDTEHPEHGELTGVVTAADDEGVWARMDRPVAVADPCVHCIIWKTRYEFCRSTVPL